MVGSDSETIDPADMRIRYEIESGDGHKLVSLKHTHWDRILRSGPLRKHVWHIVMFFQRGTERGHLCMVGKLEPSQRIGHVPGRDQSTL